MNEEFKEFNISFMVFGLASFIFYIGGRFTGGKFEEIFMIFGMLCLVFCFMTLIFGIITWLIPDRRTTSKRGDKLIKKI